MAVVVGGFFLTIGTFIANILLSYDLNLNLRNNVNRVEDIYNELAFLSQLESDLSYAENAQKNYLISRQSIYLRSQERTALRIDTVTDRISVIERYGELPKEMISKLNGLVRERLELFQKINKLIKGGTDPELNQAKEFQAIGADKTLEIRELIKEIEVKLRILLQKNKGYITRSINYGSYTNYLAIGIALVVAFFATLSISQDYLRQKEIERILRQLNDDKTRLFSILGHDLRSPLSGLNAVIYILKNHYQSLSEKEIKEYIDSLEQTSLNYSKLLEDVLTWSRLQLNKIQINPMPHPIVDLVKEVLNLYSDQLAQKRIIVENKIPGQLILKVDKAMLQTVLRNLISNGIKFSFPGGKLTLSHHEDKDWHSIVIADNGVGMNPVILKNLFSTNTISIPGTENEVGTGLGLSICKEFLAKEGGDILVESTEGKGSVFTVKLPKAEKLKKIRHSQSLLKKIS